MEMLANDKAPPGGTGSIEPLIMNNRQVLGVVTASCMGWVLDLFGLFIPPFVAPAIGKPFFPSGHAMLSLAAVYASFAVTSLMRSLRSAAFDSYADQQGRKSAMVVAVTGVSTSMAVFGLLPTAGQVGLFALVLSILLRLIQGVFVGGAVVSTYTIGTKSVPSSWRGTASGLVGGGGAGIDALLVLIIYMAVTMLFPGDASEAWGWRCMFFAGIVSSVLGLVVFSSLEESPLWKQLQATKTYAKLEVHPTRTLFSWEYHGILLINILPTIGDDSAYYLTFGYLPTFLKIVMEVPAGESAALLMVSSLIMVIVSVAAGHPSSSIGRKRLFLLIGATTPIFLSLLYQWLPAVPTMTARFVYITSLSMLGRAGFAPILTFLNKRFPTSIRASGAGLSRNIGFAIGGMMPTLASLIARMPTDFPHILGVTIGAVTLLYLVGALIVPKTTGWLGDSQQQSRPHSACGMAVSGFFFTPPAKW